MSCVLSKFSSYDSRLCLEELCVYFDDEFGTIGLCMILVVMSRDTAGHQSCQRESVIYDHWVWLFSGCCHSQWVVQETHIREYTYIQQVAQNCDIALFV